jgi:hypothetical protein
LLDPCIRSNVTVNVVVYVLAIGVEEKDIEGSELVDAVVMVATFAGAGTLFLVLCSPVHISHGPHLNSKLVLFLMEDLFTAIPLC